MYVWKLNGILYGNVVFREFDDEAKEFKVVHQFASYNTEEKPDELLVMKVKGIYLADVGEYCGEICDSEKGVLVVDVEY